MQVFADRTETIEKPHEVSYGNREKMALHVDDEEEWRDIVERSLTSLGYKVVQAANFQDAEFSAKNQRFDLYVIDGTFPMKPEEAGDREAGLKLYKLLNDLHGDSSKYVLLSGDGYVEDACERNGIPFLYKSHFAKKFESFIKALDK